MMIMKIEIIPAIDLIDGKCVRLSQGEYDSRKVYDGQPLEVAKAFEAHDPDGVLLALSGRRLHEHGVAAGIWQDGGESAHPDEGE